MCEMVMQGENLSKKLIFATKFDCYPGEDDSDEDDMDAMGQSFDIQSDLDFGAHRARSNTAARLEKMDREKKKASKTKHIKWEGAPATLSRNEMAEAFQGKNLRDLNKPKSQIKSLLAQQLEQFPNLPQNPFQMYAKYDGSAHVGVKVRKYGIFLPFLSPPDCNYPLTVVVLAAAKVQDLIGLTLYKCSIQHPNQKFKEGAENYSIHIAEDDGEIDCDFPCLDPRETVGKFGFKFLALQESKSSSFGSHFREFEKDEVDSGPVHDASGNKSKAQLLEAEQRMKGHMTAMEAPLYQSYQVYVLHPLRTKTEAHLGISGEKVEIDPVPQQKVSAKFWARQRALSYDTDCIVACDLIETKSNSRAVFRMVYYRSPSPSPEHVSGASHSLNFKHHDFEAIDSVARAVVQQMNHILELRTSSFRKEYLALKERRSHRRKSFHLGPR